MAFGINAMIAFYKNVSATSGRALLAYSTDKGRTFTKYDVDLLGFDCGDPHVTFDAVTNLWFMVVNFSDQLQILTSSDLKNWTLLSSFIPPDAERF